MFLPQQIPLWIPPQTPNSGSFLYSQNPLISQPPTEPVPIPVPVPATVPASVPASVSASVPASASATVPATASATATVPAATPGEVPASVPIPYLLPTTLETLPPKVPYAPRLSGDSGQWLPLAVMGSDVYPTQLFNRPSEPLPLFREERSSLGEISMIHPFAPACVLQRPTASSDLSWPVFPQRSDEILNSSLMNTTEKERSSVLSSEDLKLSATLTGLKRDHSVMGNQEEEKQGTDKESREDAKSTDRLSVMADIALRELKAKE